MIEKIPSISKIYINKEVAEHFAREIPDSCPNCSWNSNFLLTEEEGIVMPTSILSHECGWEKDITPWDLA